MAKMKSYATFDDYLVDQTPENRTIIRELRAFVKRTAPRLEEAVKWGNGCWLKGKVPVAYVHAERGFVQFGFMLGSRLADPRGLLEGSGSYVRHVKVFDAAEIHESALAAMLRQAIRETPERLSDLSAGSKKPAKKQAKRAERAAPRKKA